MSTSGTPATKFYASRYRAGARDVAHETALAAAPIYPETHYTRPIETADQVIARLAPGLIVNGVTADGQVIERGEIVGLQEIPIGGYPAQSKRGGASWRTNKVHACIIVRLAAGGEHAVRLVDLTSKRARLESPRRKVARHGMPLRQAGLNGLPRLGGDIT